VYRPFERNLPREAAIRPFEAEKAQRLFRFRGLPAGRALLAAFDLERAVHHGDPQVVVGDARHFEVDEDRVIQFAQIERRRLRAHLVEMHQQPAQLFAQLFGEFFRQWVKWRSHSSRLAGTLVAARSAGGVLSELVFRAGWMIAFGRKGCQETAVSGRKPVTLTRVPELSAGEFISGLWPSTVNSLLSPAAPVCVPPPLRRAAQCGCCAERL